MLFYISEAAVGHCKEVVRFALYRRWRNICGPVSGLDPNATEINCVVVKNRVKN